jgi:hypothetical protein
MMVDQLHMDHITSTVEISCMICHLSSNTFLTCLFLSIESPSLEEPACFEMDGRPLQLSLDFRCAKNTVVVCLREPIP